MSLPQQKPAPGGPGLGPTWCSSAKEMVGCSLGASRVWFTIGGGIVNEVYYPRVDTPQIRDLGFIVADGRGFWVEVKRLQQHEVSLADHGVPAVTVVHRHSRFELTLRIVPCLHRDALLVRVELEGEVGLKPYVLLAPHVGGTGRDNLAEVDVSRGRKVLWAKQGPYALALAAVDDHQSDACLRASAGYVGENDGWHDFSTHGAMTLEYSSAGPGNVALAGELLRRSTLALAFSSGRESAATLAITALLTSFEQNWTRQIEEWQEWHVRRRERGGAWRQVSPALQQQARTSAMVLRAHQDKTWPGTMVASLSIPWGNTRDEIGGYHLVWPRDLVECAGALLSLGATEEARNTLRYLVATQRLDGHWNQNQWLGGTSYWSGLQLDETAFPVLLAARLAAEGELGGIAVEDMIRRALGFIVRSGPGTDQDRWEEDAGLNAFTLAVSIAALVSGAAHLDATAAEFACAVADYWNARLEDWTTARNTPLARKHGIEAYYVRVAPRAILGDPSAIEQVLPVKNWRSDPSMKAWEQVGVDFLQLVRFGLRSADDPLIVSSVSLADALLEVRLPTGRSWYRYTSDGYGEHADGSAYDGSGQGRPWPLLTGERGHYELVAGRDPLEFLQAMAAMASSGGMLPEQVWDAPDIAERGLLTGRATGSAMPLAWAHSEFVKLLISRELGYPCDRPAAVWQRYGGRRPPITRAIWSQAAPITTIPAGVPLLVALADSANVIWSADGWGAISDVPTRDSGLGLHVAELATSKLAPGAKFEFTFHRASGEWAGRNFAVQVEAP